MNDPNIILEVHDLKKYFFSGKKFLSKEVKTVRALDGVSFSIKAGEILGVVGESGCGKSTLSRSILRLHEPTSGKVIYNGQDLLSFDKEKMRQMRRELQIIFQDPYSSLNSRMTVKEQIRAPLDVFKLGSMEERDQKVIAIMTKVGLPLEYMNRYPHEFSGGQRQRIVIARALVLDPKFIICDEPVSALDVSVRAQVLNLMLDLQKTFNLTYLFISHDLSVVRYICDRIMVMYLGKVVEIAEKKDLYADAKHPYTQALLSAIPIPDVDLNHVNIPLSGDMPSAFNPPSGCRFHTRCPRANERCTQEEPQLKDWGDNHFVACHLYDRP
ncbi:MAG: transporter ATP-binding protein [Firmicutes bacterium]|nr:transporter ATP-binding protein [Bacillota bacterium]